MLTKGPDHVYMSTLLSKLPWLRHGFGSRHSEGWLGDYTNLKQIHSDIAVVADGRRGAITQGDALIVSEPGNAIGVRTADCLPILVVDPVHRVAAIVHAGWRGTVANIVGKTIARMESEFGSKPADLLVSIGPGIGLCCFEVGPEVSAQFENIFPEQADLRRIDLAEANRRHLEAAGVSAPNTEISGLCTMCGADEFHSFRRDKDLSGRLVSGASILHEKSAG
jgi:YfiH family protein